MTNKKYVSEGGKKRKRKNKTDCSGFDSVINNEWIKNTWRIYLIHMNLKSSLVLKTEYLPS